MFFMSRNLTPEYHVRDFEAMRDEQRVMMWDMALVNSKRGCETWLVTVQEDSKVLTFGNCTKKEGS